MGKAAKRMAKKAPAKKAARAKPKPKPKPREKTVTDKDKSTDKTPDRYVEKSSTGPSPKGPLAGGTAGAYSEVTATVPPADLLTEQEKDAAAGGEGAGVGPVGPSQTTTGPVETIEDQGIGPRTPYPTGDTPPDTIETTRSQGIHKGDQPEKPKGPNK
jgi:hypothetical protein